VIHVGTALHARRALTSFVTHNKRLLDGAIAAGIPVDLSATVTGKDRHLAAAVTCRRPVDVTCALAAQHDLSDWLIVDLMPRYLGRAGDVPAAVGHGEGDQRGLHRPAISRDRWPTRNPFTNTAIALWS
jgi:hypothetical protein